VNRPLVLELWRDAKEMTRPELSFRREFLKTLNPHFTFSVSSCGNKRKDNTKRHTTQHKNSGDSDPAVFTLTDREQVLLFFSGNRYLPTL